MSDQSGGEGWWQASDGKWYPPQPLPPTQPTPGTVPPPGGYPPPTQPTAGTVPPPGGYPPPGGGTPPPGSGKPWYTRWWVIALAVLAVLLIIGAIAGGNNDKQKTSTSESAGSTTSTSSTTTTTKPKTTTTSSTTTTTTAPATTAPPQPQTVFTQSGSGIKTTKNFAVPTSDWDLNYTYDCSNFGSQGNFAVTLYQDGSLDNVVVNELGPGGSSSTAIHDGPGSYYMEINSECNWSVAAVTSP